MGSNETCGPVSFGLPGYEARTGDTITIARIPAVNADASPTLQVTFFLDIEQDCPRRLHVLKLTSLRTPGSCPSRHDEYSRRIRREERSQMEPQQSHLAPQYLPFGKR